MLLLGRGDVHNTILITVLLLGRGDVHNTILITVLLGIGCSLQFIFNITEIPECIWDRCTPFLTPDQACSENHQVPASAQGKSQSGGGVGSTVTATHSTRFHTVPGENGLITLVVCIELKYIFAVRQIHHFFFLPNCPVAGRAQVHERARRAHVLA